MRTTGTLNEVFNAARDHYNGGDTYGGLPLDAVMRYDGTKWMLESSLESAEDSIAECSLDDFDAYFFAAYAGDSLEIDPLIEKEFLNQIMN